jgi:hypothetical protein
MGTKSSREYQPIQMASSGKETSNNEITKLPDQYSPIHVTDYEILSRKKDKKYLYTGYMVHGVPHGFGTLTYTSDLGTISYTGNYIKGNYGGQIKRIIKDGKTTTIQIIDGCLRSSCKFSGTVEIIETKQTYPTSGEFVNGRYHGIIINGIIINVTISDGEYYTSVIEYTNGVKNGPFKYTNIKTTQVYSGTYVNDKVVGDVTYEHKELYFYGPTITDTNLPPFKITGICNARDKITGTTYIGNMISDIRDGFGKFYYAPDDTTYEGTFVNNLPYGKGRLTFHRKFPYEKAFSAFCGNDIYPVICESDNFISNCKFSGFALITIKDRIFKFITDQSGNMKDITELTKHIDECTPTAPGGR